MGDQALTGMMLLRFRQLFKGGWGKCNLENVSLKAGRVVINNQDAKNRVRKVYRVRRMVMNKTPDRHSRLQNGNE